MIKFFKNFFFIEHDQLYFFFQSCCFNHFQWVFVFFFFFYCDPLITKRLYFQYWLLKLSDLFVKFIILVFQLPVLFWEVKHMDICVVDTVRQMVDKVMTLFLFFGFMNKGSLNIDGFGDGFYFIWRFFGDLISSLTFELLLINLLPSFGRVHSFTQSVPLINESMIAVWK